MKKLSRSIDMFCYRHPHFGIRNLMTYVSVGSVAVWLIGTVSPTLYALLAFDAASVLRGQVWRLVTFVFFPTGNGIWALIGAYLYFMIGRTIEQYWGTPRFSLYFLTGIVLTELYGFVMYLVFHISYPITAEYIYLSMFFSFAVMFPDMQLLVFFIIPVKMKWLALVDAAFFVYEVIMISPFPLKLLPVVAILNFFIFCGGELFAHLPKNPSKETINFKKESARIRKEQQSALYRHKCSVCGRTDTDYPELEFRYCSRCAGYHCFCEDHINSHVHFTQ